MLINFIFAPTSLNFIGVLKWICLDSVIKRVQSGGYKVHEAELILHNLPEEIIDVNRTEIRDLMTAEAYSLLEKKGKELLSNSNISLITCTADTV